MPIKYVLTTVLGVVVGSTATYFIMKKGTETHINEEIESYKEYSEEKIFDLENEVNDLKSKLENLDSPTECEKEKDDTDYKAIIEEMNYSSFSEKKKVAEPEEEVPENLPYVISADAFAGERSYGKAGMTYYEKDGVFIDEDGDVVSDGMDIIGEHNLDKFGQYEEDSLFVRNEETGFDYEVILDDGAYADCLYEE